MEIIKCKRNFFEEHISIDGLNLLCMVNLTATVPNMGTQMMVWDSNATRIFKVLNINEKRPRELVAPSSTHNNKDTNNKTQAYMKHNNY